MWGEKPHGTLQGILYNLFLNNRRIWRLLPLLEQRVQTSSENYRVPDLCAVSPDDPDYIVRNPPVLCVEVLSKGDSLQSMQERVDDYLHMGVRNIWILDPLRHLAYRASRIGIDPEHDTLTIPGTPVRIALKELFQELEDLLAGRL